MRRLKDEKGSITLVVLVSCMFFIASVVCVQMYVQSKRMGVDREYKQVKANYEEDTETLDITYNQLLKLENIDVIFENTTVNNESKKITVNISVNTQNLNVKTMKYGWIYSNSQLNNPSENNITDWIYVENNNDENKIVATKNYTEAEGYYYLCFMVNNNPTWKRITINQT